MGGSGRISQLYANRAWVTILTSEWYLQFYIWLLQTTVGVLIVDCSDVDFGGVSVELHFILCSVK